MAERRNGHNPNPRALNDAVEDDPFEGVNAELADLPDADDDILSYESADRDGRNVNVGARVPPAIAAMIDELREAPNTPFPHWWPTRSHFIRWAIIEGLKRARRVLQEWDQNDDGRRGDMAGAQVFVYRTGARLRIRAEIVQKASEDVDAITGAIRTLIRIGQRQEAANIIAEYLHGAREQGNASWTAIFVGVLVDHQGMGPLLADLVTHGALVDEPVHEELINRGLVDAATRYWDEQGPEPEQYPAQ